MEELHWNTVTPLLQSALRLLMAEPLFDNFRLVGGTSLSLQTGHRMSVDIDLFTDATYGTVNFMQIHDYLSTTFPYISPKVLPDTTSMGISYIVGNDSNDAFKLDIYYTDDFVYPVIETENIRLASTEEIAAMKIDVIQRGGRKKDFWDIHTLLDYYTIEQMIDMHQTRYPFNHDSKLIRKQLLNFSTADDDFEPVCLNGKHWEVIKLDITDIIDRK